MEQALIGRTALLYTMNEARTDLHRRRIVDAGIAVQGSSNTMSAVE
jgi:hypothetical protein